MKLHTKLILTLLGGLIIVVTLAQGLQYRSIIQLINQLTESNIQLLREREEANAINIYLSAERAVAGSLERGEMKKFTKILRSQQEIQGLLEFSLFDKNGVVTHTSDTAFLNNELPSSLRERLLTTPDRLLQYKNGALEIYQPQPITGDCIRCHTDWKEGKIGGVTFFRFSTEALTNAERQAATSISTIKKTLSSNSIFTVLGIIVVLVTAMYFLVRLFVAKPLGKFVWMLRQFERDEGDLTRRVLIESRDEIGGLAGLFNSFIDKLNKVIAQSQKTAFVVGSGATQQASAVEETSASIEQISAMTKDNAEKAQETNELMQGAIKEINGANESMKKVNEAMDDLSSSSNKVAKIIKTIDEIAFQTNLLALNAAVEAARAGEAGQGFAVVADEVRNLAMRSAEAAKNTAALIEDTVAKIQYGDQLLENTSQAFSNVTERSHKASILVDEIASASEEQAQGIGQVNRALIDIDQATQQNATQAISLSETMSVFKTDFDSGEELLETSLQQPSFLEEDDE